jgi:ADP-ribose pyrophosphatase
MSPPEDEHLIERTIASEEILRGRFLHAKRDTVALPDGTTATREFILHPGAVMMIPLLDDGRVVLERQFRYPMQRVMTEFPAGKIDPGEDHLVCARRELLEETGYVAAEWAHAGVLHPVISYSDEFIGIWFCRGLRQTNRKLDAGEFLDVFHASLESLEGLAQRGELTDAKTLVAMLWLRQWRDGRWPLEWRPAPD